MRADGVRAILILVFVLVLLFLYRLLESPAFGADCYTNLTPYSQEVTCTHEGKTSDAFVGGGSTTCGGKCVVKSGGRACPTKLIASIHRCDLNGCDVLLPDGTKGKTVKWPVEFGKVSEVCSP